MSCGVGRRHGSDLAFLWLWRRPAATAPIQPLAWELPYAMGAVLKKKIKIVQSKNIDLEIQKLGMLRKEKVMAPGD